MNEHYSPLTPIPPAGHVPPVTAAVTPQGVWSDGYQLVAHVEQAQLPACCIKTGAMNPEVWEDVKLEWVPNAATWAVLFGAIGLAIAKAISGRKVMIRVPVNAEWIARHKQSKVIGWSLVIGGLVMIIGGTFGFGIGLSSGLHEDTAGLILLVSALGLFVTLGGLIYMAIFYRSLLKVSRVVDDYAWIKGACPEFLAQLPPFPY